MERNNKKGLKIIIVGMGKVGQTLAEQLSEEAHDITVIDTTASKVADITGRLDIMGVVGNGASYSILNEAGIKETDLIIAVTGSDELNLLCCTMATAVGDISAIARVRTPDYSNEIGYLQQKLGLAMVINPELEAAKEIARILYLPSALEVNTFANDHAEMIKIKIPAGNILVGKDMIYLGKNIYSNILVCAVERDGEVYIPTGGFTLEEGDVISFVASTREIAKFFKAIELKAHRVKDCIIVGGGKVAYYLAKQLFNMNIKVKVIESDHARCEELSDLLPQAVIINGDGTDQDLLEEEGLKYAGSFIPLTGMDEENIMLTMYAKNVSSAKVVTKINRLNFKNVISGLDLGSIVYPRFITSEAIIAYVRAKSESMDRNIENLYHMFDQRIEAIEFYISEDSDATNMPLMDLKLKDNLLISCINRNGKIIIPSGQDMLLKGDSVMVVTKHKGFSDIQDILVK